MDARYVFGHLEYGRKPDHHGDGHGERLDNRHFQPHCGCQGHIIHLDRDGTIGDACRRCPDDFGQRANNFDENQRELQVLKLGKRTLHAYSGRTGIFFYSIQQASDLEKEKCDQRELQQEKGSGGSEPQPTLTPNPRRDRGGGGAVGPPANINSKPTPLPRAAAGAHL